jgi:hypothetical protein
VTRPEKSCVFVKLFEGCGFVGIARSENDELFVIHQNGDGESVFYDYEKYEGLKMDDNE